MEQHEVDCCMKMNDINWRHDSREIGANVRMTSNLEASKRNTCILMKRE